MRSRVIRLVRLRVEVHAVALVYVTHCHTAIELHFDNIVVIHFVCRNVNFTAPERPPLTGLAVEVGLIRLIRHALEPVVLTGARCFLKVQLTDPF